MHIGKDFGRFVKSASDKVIAHARILASKRGRPYVYQNSVVRGKDELARQMALEDVLIRSGIVGPDAVESYEPDAERRQAIKAARNAFVADIFDEFRRIGSMEKGSG